jgi:preprotein translocase SecE subunit
MDANQPQAPSSLPIPKVKRGGLKGYLTDVSRELKKVDWPPVPEVHRLTGVVLSVLLLIAVIMTSMSLIADTLMRILQGNL